MSEVTIEREAGRLDWRIGNALTPSLPIPESLQRQFRLTRTDPAAAEAPDAEIRRDSWSTRAFPNHDACGQWRLEHHPTLGVTQLDGADGAPLGWILGSALDLRAGRPLAGRLQLNATATSEAKNHEAICADILDRLHGTFLIVYCAPRFARIYPAVTACLGCVYDASSGRVASTPLALLGPDDYLGRVSSGGRGEIDGALAANVFDLTCVDGVRRLLPNHFLDLDTMRMQRFWPTAEFREDRHPVEAMDAIRTIGAAALGALPRDRSLLAPLTAGRDSRLILALCQLAGTSVEAFTIGHARDIAPIDVEMAPAVAKLAGVSHRLVDGVVSSPHSEREWIERSGRALIDSNTRLFETLRCFASESYVLPGFGGEIARGMLWRTIDRSDTQISAIAALNRINALITDSNIAAAGRWLSSVEGLSTFAKLDLLFWEVARPRGAQIYGPDFVYEDVALLLHPRILQSMLRLPVEYRRTRRLARDFMDIYRPELTRLPFNAYPDWRRAPQIFGKFINPSRLKKYFRIYTA